MDTRRQLLLDELVYCVEQLNRKHSISKNVPNDDLEGLRFVEGLEAVLLNGLLSHKGTTWEEEFRRHRSISTDVVSMWPFIEGKLSISEAKKLNVISAAESDIRKCRTWIRLTLNKPEWFEEIKHIISCPKAPSDYYDGSSILCNSDLVDRLLFHLKSIRSLSFQYTISDASLLSWSENSLKLSGILQSSVDEGELTASVDRQEDGRISPPTSDFSLDLTPSDSITSNNNIETSNVSQLQDFKEFYNNYGAVLKRYARCCQGQHKTASAAEHNTEPLVSPLSMTEGSRGQKKSHSSEQGDEYVFAEALEYEVVDASIPTLVSIAKKSGAPTTLTGLLTELTVEKGLDVQDYRCAACKCPIGMIFGEALLCHYTSQYYCSDCHCNEERIIPARVIFNWDFSKYAVSTASAHFIDSISDEAVINMKEANPQIYNYVPELSEIKDLRLQLFYLKDFINTCREDDIRAKLMQTFPLPYFYENIHDYSLIDLVKVENGQMSVKLKRGVEKFIQHVKKCELCSLKGFFCDICVSNEIIYPFQLDIVHKCEKCHSRCHAQCWRRQPECKKCSRLSRLQEK